MALDRPVAAFLRRLEREISGVVSERGPLVVAFSGGLGSLIVAALARKRGDLRCVVAGLPHSPDVAAAILTERFLDFPLETVPLTARGSLSIARTLAQQYPRLRPRDVLSLVPLVAAWDRGATVSGFAGFDDPSRSAEFADATEALSFLSPVARSSSRGTAARARLLAVARALAIPDAFARVSSREPAVGSGVAPALRALAKEDGVTMESLLRSRDYQ